MDTTFLQFHLPSTVTLPSRINEKSIPEIDLCVTFYTYSNSYAEKLFMCRMLGWSLFRIKRRGNNQKNKVSCTHLTYILWGKKTDWFFMIIFDGNKWVWMLFLADGVCRNVYVLWGFFFIDYISSLFGSIKENERAPCNDFPSFIKKFSFHWISLCLHSQFFSINFLFLHH